MSKESLEKSERTPPVSWRPWALAYSRDRPYNFSCLSAVSKNRRFRSFFSALGYHLASKAFRDQQCQFLTRKKSLSIENESNCSMTSECVRTDLILPRVFFPFPLFSVILLRLLRQAIVPCCSVKKKSRVTSLEADLAWQELFAEMPTRERAQMLSQASPGASAFLSAVPSLPELYLSTAEMRTSLRRWLRLPVFKNIPSGPCTCSATSRTPALSSDHLLTCRNEGMLGRRHDNLRRTLRDMATTAGLIAEEEPRGLPGFGQGGGDLLVHDIHPGQAIVADVCVVSEHVDALAETASCRAGLSWQRIASAKNTVQPASN